MTYLTIPTEDPTENRTDGRRFRSNDKSMDVCSWSLFVLRVALVVVVVDESALLHGWIGMNQAAAHIRDISRLDSTRLDTLSVVTIEHIVHTLDHSWT